MRLRKNEVGLSWSTFLNVKNPEEVLNRAKQCNCERNFEFSFPFFDPSNVNVKPEDLREAYVRVALQFCLQDTELAKELFDDVEVEKAEKLFLRKQYNSKLLQTLLYRFSIILNEMNNVGTANFFIMDIARMLKTVHNEHVDRAYAPLKKAVDSIASGVKSECYLAAERYFPPKDFLDERLNEFLKNEFSYDFNNVHKLHGSAAFSDYNDGEKRLGRILCLGLFDDEKFWESRQNFNVLLFIEKVAEYNDLSRAQKLLKHIFGKIKESPEGRLVLEASLPLVYLEKDRIIAGFEAHTLNYSFKRFNGQYNLDKIDACGLVYPLTKIDEDIIDKGRVLTEKLFTKVYGDDGACALEFLRKELLNSSPVREFTFEGKMVKGDYFSLDVDIINDKRSRTVNEILDYSTFWDWDIDRRAVEAYEPTFFSRENVLKRLYIKAYKAYQLTDDEDKSAACLFELIYDIFVILNYRLNIKTLYQLDMKGRENIFAALKKLLKKYGIDISEEHKKDYIISMLDRKVALIEESARFPVLEQLGDAIYGFAVAEMLFYNPESDDNIKSDFESYISAYAQVKVALKLGIDKLYYSSDTCDGKYDYESFLTQSDSYLYKIAERGKAHSAKRKYLADSLEMIIAVLCNDCGYRTAIDFAKRLIRDTFPEEFPEEVRWETAKDRGLREYWARVFPAPYADFTKYTEMMRAAYMKFMGVYSIGTDDLINRVALTQFPYFESFMLSNVNERDIAFYEYLHNGLDYAIKVYSARIAEEFNNRVKPKHITLGR